MNKFLTYHFLVRFGLGVIFIANALVALFSPAEFIELIKNSLIVNLIPVNPETFASTVIVLNDFIVGLLLISGFATRRIALWAAVWLVGVMVVIGELFDVLEHLGLLFMTVALVFGDKYSNKNI